MESKLLTFSDFALFLSSLALDNCTLFALLRANATADDRVVRGVVELHMDFDVSVM